MAQQVPVAPDAIAGAMEGNLHVIAPDLAYRRLAIVNAVFVGAPDAGDRGWTLIDAGIPGSAPFIARAAEHRFGPAARPAAIVLTHGHFDHVGALETLAERWDTPVVAHPAEMPHLDGRASYPPPDTAAGGGLMPLLSPLMPRGPVNVGPRLVPLPEDGSVPGMPGWRWLPTPGHTEGHVSFWRPADRTIIAGDAFVTTAQESAYAIAVQEPEIHGPPRYFTPGWEAAKISVARLASLQPELAVTGHGQPLRGEGLRRGLDRLAHDFEQLAVPPRRG